MITPSFRLVKFSPVPEFLDPVNVALIVQNGRTKIHFDDAFRRLKCVAPHFDGQALRVALLDLESRLSRDGLLDDGEDRVDSHSAQLVLGRPQPILSESQKAIDTLAALYLNPLSGNRKKRQRAQIYRQTQLQDYLVESVGLSAKSLLKSRPLGELLSPKAARLIREPDLKIDRAFSGPKGLILLDALSFGLTTEGNIQQRAHSISLSFYALGKNKTLIEDIESKELTRTAVIFEKEKVKEKIAYEYFLDKVADESDLLIDSTSGVGIDRLREVIGRANPDLLQQ